MKLSKYIVSKYSRILFLGLALFGSQSCSEVLEESVISNVPNNYINSAKGLDDAVAAAYNTLRTWYGTEAGNNFTIFGTDTYTNGADGSWKFMNTYTNDFDTRNGNVQQIWDDFYRGINTCNAILDRSKDITGVSELTKKQRIAEAKFIRAHHYFLLTQLFGGIDLRLTETLTPTKETKRATVAAQYAQIIKDLTEAIPDLEAKSKAIQYGRATKPAAENLLGKVYLTKATSEAKASDDFAKAIPLFQGVINNYGLRLLPDFASVHQVGNEINDEIIMSVQYTRDPLTNGTGNNAHVFFLMEYDTQSGMLRDIINGRPFKRFRPTVYTYDVVFKDRDNDSRYKKTFNDTYLSNNPGTYNTFFDTSKPRVTFALGDTAIFLPGFEMTVAERAKRKYQVLVPSRYDERLFLGLRKQMDPIRIDRTQFEGGRDYFMMRLADTYLMLAEAQIQTGNRADAAKNINLVRTRAAWPGKTAQMQITDAQATMDFIYEERERELIGEQFRWFDLKRWGNLIERVKRFNPQAAGIKDFHVLRPIPQTQIDRAEGGASAFPQNTGY